MSKDGCTKAVTIFLVAPLNFVILNINNSIVGVT